MMMLKSIKSWRDKILFCINLRPSAVSIFCHAVSHCGGWGTYYYHNCGGDFPVTSPVSQLQSGVESTDNAGRGQMEIAELMAALLPSWMGEGENHAIKTLTQPLSASILLLLLINLHLYPLNMIWFCLRPPCLLFRLRTAAAGWSWISPDFMADTRQLWTPDLGDFKCPLPVTLWKFSTFVINVQLYKCTLIYACPQWPSLTAV